MAVRELECIRARILKETEDLCFNVLKISHKLNKADDNVTSLVQLVLSFQESIKDITTDHISHTPQEILEKVISECDTKDVRALSCVSKRFYRNIHNDEFWKKRSYALWQKIVPSTPNADLDYLKEKVQFLTWKKIVKFLSNPNEGKYTHVWKPDIGWLYLKQFDNKNFLPEKSIYFSIQKTIYLGNVLPNGAGLGTWISTKGETYCGDFFNWKPQGDGKYTYKNGSRYTGQFESGKRNGQGIIIYASEAIYNGQWRASKRHGKGTVTYPSGYRYQGQWTSGRPTNVENCIDPVIQRCLEKNKCTKTIPFPETTYLPQMLFYCNVCEVLICKTCQQDDCHQCDNKANLQRNWSDLAGCGCEREECKQDKKKQRII